MEVIAYSLPFLGQGLLVTLEVSALVVGLSLGFGLVMGVGVTYGPLARRVAGARLQRPDPRHPGAGADLLRLLRHAGDRRRSGQYWAAVAALSAFMTAHVIEIVRGALQSIHHGQTEAGKAIGLTFGQRMVYVIFPQAIRRFLPPWINAVTDAVKGSALVSLIGVVDLMLAVQQVIGRIYEPMPLYVLGALIYFTINYALSTLSRRLEVRYAFVRE